MAVAAVLFVLALLPASGAAKIILRASVDPHEKGVLVHGSFLGISTDWGVVNTIGYSADGEDPIWVRLMRTLAATGGGMPTLRVGGNYQDNAWWDPSGKLNQFRPILHTPITAATLQALAANARLLHQRMILGINLGANDPALGRNEAVAMLRYLQQRDIISFDLGNEPDDYKTTIAYTKTVHGRPVSVPFRGAGWNGNGYLHQFDRIAAAVHRIRPGIPVSGMDGYGQLVTADHFLAHERHRVSMYTEHTYPLDGYSSTGRRYRPGDRNYPSLARLLSPVAMNATLHQTELAVAAGRKHHKPVQITEMNSVSGATVPGVTNSMAAGLWALDMFFLDAALGVHGIDFHIDAGPEAPFILYYDYIHYSPARWVGLVSPIYFSMLMFDQAIGHQGHVLVNPTLMQKTAPGFNARVWVVRGSHGGYSIVFLNKDLHHSGMAQVTIPGSRKAGTLTRFVAPAPGSLTGETLGGLSIAAPTFDGSLLGHRRQTTVRPRQSTYAVYLRKGSAALLTVP